MLGFETRLGPGLMPWQNELNALATERDGAGRFVFRQAVVEVMRQQGKSVDLLSMMVHRAFWRPGSVIAYTAQTHKESRKRLIDSWWPRIEQSAFGRRNLIDIRRGSGSEALLFQNGSILELVSPTDVGGHGDTLDLGVIDEAWAHADDHIEQAMRPAMMTRDAQLWVVSAAGTPKSEFFRSKVEDGRSRAQSGATDTSCYIGYSFADDEDPADPEVWWRRMPALGITVTEDTVKADLDIMDFAEFRRAYGCQWPDVANPGWDVIGQDAWAATERPRGLL